MRRFVANITRMGAWGFNILENDTSADGHGEYVDCVNAGLSAPQILEKLGEVFSEVLSDPEDSAYLWLGIAKAQWEYGHLDDAMVRRVEEIATSPTHLAEWDDSGPKGRKKRERVLAAFVAKLRTPNPRPKKPRKARLRTPIYEPGTCLAVSRPDGRYLAALVTFHRIENPRPGQDTYGLNTVVLLDYLESVPPSLDVFVKRRFAYLEQWTHFKPWLPASMTCYAESHRKSKETLHVVGHIPLVRADAFEGRAGAGGYDWKFREAEKTIHVWRESRNTPGLKIGLRWEDFPEWIESQAEIDRLLIASSPDAPPRQSLEEILDLSPLSRNDK